MEQKTKIENPEKVTQVTNVYNYYGPISTSTTKVNVGISGASNQLPVVPLNPEEEFQKGFAYHHGQGVPKNSKKAVEHYITAAKYGHLDACFHLGYCYQNGDGIKKDLSLAIKYYMFAFEKGHSGAELNLAFCYQHGQGVQKNMATALELYRSSAKKDNPHALYNLAYFYEHGHGVTKDLKIAVEYYQLSVEKNGPEQAKQNLENLLRAHPELRPNQFNINVSVGVHIVQPPANPGYYPSLLSVGAGTNVIPPANTANNPLPPQNAYFPRNFNNF